MARKSAASLAVVTPPAAIQGARLPPPAHLSKASQAVWREVVAASPVGFFGREAMPLLETLAHALSEHRRLTRFLEDAADLGELAKLSRLIDAHAARIAVASTKLRLSNQARFTPKDAGKQELSSINRMRMNYGLEPEDES